jgi:fibronectin type 3 domain-containing protein
MVMKKIWMIPILTTLLVFSCETTTPIDEDDLTPPGVPANFRIDEELSGDGEIMLKWNANNEDDFHSYRLYRTTNSDIETTYTLLIETTQNQYLNVGLDYNTTYYYRLSAIDVNDNESEKGDEVHLKPLNLIPPAIPQGVKVYGYNVPSEPVRIDVQWTANTETDFLHYNVYKFTSGLFAADSTTFLQNLTTTSFSDTAITIGTKYYYKVTAVDKGLKESQTSDLKSDLALANPEQTSPASNATGQPLRPTFTWQKLDGATKYNVIVQTSSQSGEIWTGTVVQPTSGTTVSMQFPVSPTLAKNTNYYWKVASFSSDNTQANSYSPTWRFTTTN